MSKPVAPHRWFTGWRSAAARAPQDDPADLGTAFGLDMSLGDETLPHAPPEPAPAAAGRSPGWVQRLTLRRRPAY
jgi:hypothetical protein